MSKQEVIEVKAAVLEEAGKALKIYDDIDIIEPRAGEVRVKIEYCGICHSDLSVANGTFPAPGPVILGHEASGVIEALGEGVSHLNIGDHVVLTPAPPCGQCYYCTRNEHSLCVNGQAIMTHTLPDGETGLSRDGATIMRGVGVAAFAQYVVTQSTGAIKIDPDIPLDIACVIGCALQTGVGAVINTANVEEGSTVLVMGLGGVGMATVQGARIAGATKIIVSDPVAERRELAKSFGATHTLDPSIDDVVARCLELTNGIGVDYAFETAGLAPLIETGIFASRSGGTTVCVGAPPIDQAISINPAVLFAATEKKLCGCLLGSSNSLFEVPRLIRLWQSGKLDLESMITHRRPLSQINEAFDDLANNRGIRTVIKIGE